jgi:hypothetical protein
MAALQQEYTALFDQWQPFNENIPHHSTNGSPSTRTYRIIRPMVALQQEYTASFGQ